MSNSSTTSDPLPTAQREEVPARIVSVAVSQCMRIAPSYLESVDQLTAALTAPGAAGRCWRELDGDLVVELDDRPTEEAMRQIALLASNGSYQFMTDLERIIALTKNRSEPEAEASDHPFDISWKLQRIPATSRDMSSVNLEVDLVLREIDRLTEPGPAPDQANARIAAHAEKELFGAFDLAIFDLLFDYEVLRDDYERTIDGRMVGSPFFYKYTFDRPVDLDGPELRTLTQTHLAHAGPDSSAIDVSVLGDGVIALRFLLENRQAYQPHYVIVSDERNEAAVGDLVDSISILEGVGALELWDISTDTVMHEDHLFEHDLAIDEIRLVLNESLAETTASVEPPLVQRALSSLDQRIVLLADSVRSARRQFETYDGAVASFVYSMIDEKQGDGSGSVSDGLTKGRMISQVRNDLDRIDGHLARLQQSYEYLHEAAGRIADDLRARELAFLDRQAWTMNLLLGLLAVVLAFEAVVDFRFETTNPSIELALQTGTLVVAGLAALGIVLSIIRRSGRRAASLPQQISEVLRYINDVNLSPTWTPESDRAAAIRFAQLWQRADGGSDPVSRLCRALLRASRPSELYSGPCPWLASSYMAALRIANWEFDRTVTEWGFVSFLHATKLREAIVDAPRDPIAVIEALQVAGAGDADPEDVTHAFAVAMDLDPDEYQLETPKVLADLEGQVAEMDR